jgi:hypothetical protein
MLYMFRTRPVSIIRSSVNCNHNIWGRQPECVRLSSWLSQYCLSKYLSKYLLDRNEIYTFPIFDEGGYGFFLRSNSRKCQPEGCAWQCSFSVEITSLCSCKLAPQKFPGKKKYCSYLTRGCRYNNEKLTRGSSEDCLKFSNHFHRSVRHKDVIPQLTVPRSSSWHNRQL